MSAILSFQGLGPTQQDEGGWASSLSINCITS